MTTEVKEWLEKKPPVVEASLGDKYIVKIIPPDTDIDHKIQIIRANPEIDFKIRIFNPYGQNLNSDLLNKLEEAIREQMQREEKP